jgi:hypothetical protein
MKSRNTRILVILLAVVCVGAAVVGLRVLAGYGVNFHSSFKKVQVGMSEAQVVAALGVANERSSEFRLGQYRGFEQAYARAAASGSSYYLLWSKGIDVVYAVGFDKDGSVTMKAVGGT